MITRKNAVGCQCCEVCAGYNGVASYDEPFDSGLGTWDFKSATPGGADAFHANLVNVSGKLELESASSATQLLFKEHKCDNLTGFIRTVKAEFEAFDLDPIATDPIIQAGVALNNVAFDTAVLSRFELWQPFGGGTFLSPSYQCSVYISPTIATTTILSDTPAAGDELKIVQTVLGGTYSTQKIEFILNSVVKQTWLTADVGGLGGFHDPPCKSLAGMRLVLRDCGVRVDNYSSSVVCA